MTVDLPAPAGAPGVELATAPAEAPAEAPAAPSGQTVVEMTVYGRSVRVEAPDSLDRVSAAAVHLWERLEDPPRPPLGTSGFVIAEQPGPAPLEMDPPVLFDEVRSDAGV